MSRVWNEDVVLGKVKRHFLRGAGINGVRIATQYFRAMDINNNGELSPKEFENGIKGTGLKLTPFEVKYLQKAFDQNNDGVISLNEFLFCIVGCLNAKRQAVVMKVFESICDREGHGPEDTVAAEFLLRVFDPAQHPAVKHGTMLGSTIEDEFVNGFGIDANNDGQINLEEFKAFFTGVSATMPNDEVFEEMMLLCFGADDSTKPRLDKTERDWSGKTNTLDIEKCEHPNDPYAKGIYGTVRRKGYDATFSAKTKYLRQEPPLPSLLPDYVSTMKRSFQPPGSEELLEASGRVKHASPTGSRVADRIRSKILMRAGEDGFQGLQRAFMIMDKNRSASLSMHELKMGLDRVGIELTPMELQEAIKFVDRNGNGVVQVGEFIRAIRGPMKSKRRIEILLEAFERLDPSGDGVVQLGEIAGRYDASRHPKVLSGAMSEEAVVRDFIADWDGNSDGNITPEEWIDYYGNISASIDDDRYFELMIRNAWHISGGKDCAANTTCRRVLAVFGDGRSRVVEIKDDLGVAADDTAEMMRRLEAQGIRGVVEIKLHF